MKPTTYPPGPRSLIPGAQLLEIPKIQRDPPGYLLNLARQYGDIAHFDMAGTHIYLLNNPDDIRDVLVTKGRCFMKGQGLQRVKALLGEGLLTSEGEFHLRQRRLAQPAFHRQRIGSYGAAMTKHSAQMSAAWQDGATLDMHHEMMRLTLAIVGQTLFDANMEGQAVEVRDALNDMGDAVNGFTAPFIGLTGNLPSANTQRFEQARARLDAIIYRLIAEHRASGDRGDLLSMLLLAQDEEGDGGRMSDEQLRDEAMTIFLAGHETTSNALTWTWYLLSQNPDAEAKLHAEFDRVLAGRAPTMDDMEPLRYTRMVMSESMRLYPPAWTLGRRALQDVEIGGYVIPAGSIVMMSQWVMHHNARYYPDPFRFDPERWTPEAQAARPKFAYFPFGAGARMCIGDQFAMLESILLLATLAQRWQPRLVPGHPIELLPQITLRPKHGMQMVLHKR